MSTTITDGYPNRGPAVFSVTTATLVLATTFVIARVICRVGIVKNVSADDYIILIAWLFAFFLSFTIDMGTMKGLGRHDENIEDWERPSLRRAEYVFSVLYNPALMATKTSILVFYLRLARNTQKVLRYASWAVLILVNIAGTILTFMNIFQCQPINAAWDPTVKSQRCIPLLTEFICSAPVNVTTDLAILALPIPVLTGMRLPQRQKTILIITFALGIFVAVVDVIRIYYLQQAITIVSTGATSDMSALFGDSAEFSWNASLSLMWSAVEVNVGITCACIPTLKPLIIRILPAMIIDPDGSWTRRSRESQLATNNTTTKRDSVSDTAAFAAVAQANNLRPPPSAQLQVPGAEMSLMDFLTSPESVPPGSQPPRSPLLSHPTASTIGPPKKNDSALYFGFVNLKRPKSMLRTSVKESWRYCTVVSILFFLWGFSYGLLNTLNNVIADVADMEQAQTLGLTSVYFGGGYFFGPLLVGEWILRHDEHHRRHRRSSTDQADSLGGFKITFIAGLLIYGTGTIMFWPSAVLTAFGGFMISSFVVGFGLGVLETAANPFLALCGPNEYAETRLLLAQGIQGVGSVLSGLLADNVFFKTISSADAKQQNSTLLLDVQWTYLAVTLFCVLLALFFYYMPLPEVSDGALGRLAQELPVDPKKRLYGRLSVRTWAIIFAVAAQWTYVASQELMSIYFDNIVGAYAPTDATSNPAPGMVLTNSNFLLVAHTAFAVSRFACGYLAYLVVKHPNHRWIPTPRTMLTTSVSLTIIFALITVVIKPVAHPSLMFVPIVLFFLSEGPMWPLIFALGLRGQGKRTKRAAAWLTMGASGPAFWPFVIYAMLNRGISIQTAFILVVALLVISLIYPLFLTFSKDAKAMVDPFSILGEKRRSSTARTNSTASPPRVEYHEDLAHHPDEQQKERVQGVDMAPSPPRNNSNTTTTTATTATGTSGSSSAPWEDQILDTTMLNDE
ncbi:MFS general substrate transporter [Thozetella sp. PMI_491]|nr:MFS general substrate transporter [Thozetella sp. PMI_491]